MTGNGMKAKKPLWKKWWFWILLFFGIPFVFLLVVGTIGNNLPKDTAITPSVAPQITTTTPQPTKVIKPLTMTDKLWIALDKSMNTRDGYSIEYDQSSKTASVISNVKEALDENDLVRGSYTLLVKYGREAFKIDGVDAVRVVVRTQFTDQYGKDSTGDAVRIIMGKEQFGKFNWNNLVDQPVSLQIKSAAEGYYVVPSVDIKTSPDKLYLSI